MTNVVFDFGGVLIDWSPDRVYRPYFGSDEAMQRFYDETQILILNREMDRGMPYDQALALLAQKHPRYAEAARLWKTRWHKMIGGEIKGSVELLYRLKNAGYRLFGLTNWAAETFPFAYYSYEFFQEFEDIIVSGREGVIKPEPAIFELCLERNRIKAHESVFIDDNRENVDAAVALGFRGIHFQNPVQLEAALRQLQLRI
jgi:2-haloacid dehalogenase